MNTTRALAALTLGLGLFPAGCLYGGDGSDVEAIGSIPLETLGDDNGQSGNNGLDVGEFHANKGKLLNVLALPLFVDGSPDVLTANPMPLFVNNDNTINEAGRRTFGYAVKCARPAASMVTDAGGGKYEGDGFLDDLFNIWPSFGLNGGQQMDVMACIATHLNPAIVSVPLFLTGPAIQTVKNNVDEGFTWKEALWAAEWNAAGLLKIHVWPLPDLRSRCHALTKGVMTTRVCGEGESCGLEVHETLDGCTGPATNYYNTCTVNGVTKNVIQSWLDPDFLPDYYNCPPQ
ncbi:hypothetical protein [Polyangium aurulentum]|uniref:hypothetical protein n=1 Tax=Polyangium aurulentum TaxID=2567896 RepID=UPI0010AE1D0A|nr:hypothetical protein [Polyangium aurulentum]UQA55100.1 hypothetical protein E8A73_027530 [Polyangium aurulentum]